MLFGHDYHFVFESLNEVIAFLLGVTREVSPVFLGSLEEFTHCLVELFDLYRLLLDLLEEGFVLLLEIVLFLAESTHYSLQMFVFMIQFHHLIIQTLLSLFPRGESLTLFKSAFHQIHEVMLRAGRSSQNLLHKEVPLRRHNQTLNNQIQ